MKSLSRLRLEFCNNLGRSRLLAPVALTLVSTLIYPNAQAKPQCPNSPLGSKTRLTRAELAVIITQAYSLNHHPNKSRLHLQDVPLSYPEYSAIQEAIIWGLMKPDKNARFFPARLVTRDEGFSILAQASGIPQIDSTTIVKTLAQYREQAKILPWFRKNMAIATRQGIVNTDKGLRPRDWMTPQDLCYGIAHLKALKAPLPPAAPKATNTKPASPSQENQISFFPWILLGSIAALGGILLGIYRWLDSLPENQGLNTTLTTLNTLTAQKVKSLLVTEQNVQENKGITKVLRKNEKVLLGPASFGTALNCTYIINNLPKADKLFSIKALPEGNLLLTAHTQEPLVCNGRPVPPEGVKLSGQERFQVDYQHRQWSIQPSYELYQPSHTAYFSQLQAK